MKHATLKGLAAAAMLFGLVGTADAATFRLTTDTTVTFQGVSWGPLDITYEIDDNTETRGRSTTRLTANASSQNVNPVRQRDTIDVSVTDGFTTITQSLRFSTLFRSKVDEFGTGNQLGYVGAMRLREVAEFDFGYGTFTLETLRGRVRADTPFSVRTPNAPLFATSKIRSTASFAPVPLPASGFVLLAGLAGLGLMRMRKGSMAKA